MDSILVARDLTGAITMSVALELNFDLVCVGVGKGHMRGALHVRFFLIVWDGRTGQLVARYVRRIARDLTRPCGVENVSTLGRVAS